LFTLFMSAGSFENVDLRDAHYSRIGQPKGSVARTKNM
jgi:hypothetical protein